jgi:hypothetical protein
MSWTGTMIFGNAVSFSVSGNFRPDFGIGFMHQRHEIRRSQFADAAARDFCLTIANHPGCEDNGNPLLHQRQLLQSQAVSANRTY